MMDGQLEDDGRGHAKSIPATANGRGRAIELHDQRSLRSNWLGAHKALRADSNWPTHEPRCRTGSNAGAGIFRSLLVEKLSQTNDNIVTLPKYTVFSR
jgi:hypothetical protein